jgi:hypothetical protein
MGPSTPRLFEALWLGVWASVMPPAKGIRAAAIVGLVIACATPESHSTSAPDPNAALRAEVEHLETEGEQLFAARAESLWRRWTNGELSAGVTVQPDLASPAALSQIDQLRNHVRDPSEVRRLTRLRSFLADEAMAEADDALSEEIADIIGGATFSVDTRDVPYRDLDAVLAAEPDAGQRGKIWTASLSVVERLNPLISKRIELREKTVRGLGYSDLLSFSAALREIPLDTVSVLADDFLSSTNDLHQASLRALASRALGTAEMTRADFPRLFQTNSIDSSFPAGNSAVFFRSLAGGLGMDLSGLALDLEQRKGKIDAPLCVPLRLPGDVRCSLPPRAGINALAALLRQGAQGMRMSSFAAKEFEFRWLGGTAVGLAYGELFERLTEDPAFLAQAGVPNSAAATFVGTRAALRLHSAREAAGRFLVEKSRLGGLAPDPESAYLDTMGRAYGISQPKSDGERHLVDTADLLASSDEFRAALLAAQLEAHLVQRFGGTWWTKPEAGALLRSLWKDGTEKTPDEVVIAIGGRALRMDAFVAASHRQLESFSAAVTPQKPAAVPPRSDGGDAP